MNKQNIFFILVAIAILVIIYFLWQNNKKWQAQFAFNGAVKSKFPDLMPKTEEQITEESTETETEEIPQEENTYEETTKEEEEQPEMTNEEGQTTNDNENDGDKNGSETEQSATEEEIQSFCLKIANLATPYEFAAEEKQFYENNKETIERVLVELAEFKKQEEDTKNEKIFNLINADIKDWSPTKLRNHIKKLEGLKATAQKDLKQKINYKLLKTTELLGKKTKSEVADN